MINGTPLSKWIKKYQYTFWLKVKNEVIEANARARGIAEEGPLKWIPWDNDTMGFAEIEEPEEPGVSYRQLGLEALARNNNDRELAFHDLRQDPRLKHKNNKGIRVILWDAQNGNYAQRQARAKAKKEKGVV
jgi:hypothetical protein